MNKVEFDDKAIEYDQSVLGGPELQCIDVIPDLDKPSDFACFVGSMSGKLAHITKGYFGSDIEVI